MEGKVYSACVQIVLTYETETWAVEAEDLHSLVGREYDGEVDVWSVIEGEMRFCTVFWVFRVWLRWWGMTDWDLRWFGHLEYKSRDDWVSDCRNVEVVGEKCKGKGRKT